MLNDRLSGEQQRKKHKRDQATKHCRQGLQLHSGRYPLTHLSARVKCHINSSPSGRAGGTLTGVHGAARPLEG